MGKQSKRARTSSRHCKKAPFPPPTENNDALLKVRLAFANFLISAALVRSDTTPSFYTIRGVHKWSLSLHLCMLPREYCALLIACDLVEVRKTALGGANVRLKMDKWKEDFIQRYIQKDKLIGDSLCEFTTNNAIDIKALQDGSNSINRDGNPTYERMALLRVGAYAVAGERVKSTLQINDRRTEPPRFDHRTRTAQRKLTNSIRRYISDIYTGDDIDYVMEWLEMVDVLEDTDNKKMAPPPPPSKPNNSTANNNNDPTPIKPSSSTPPINNKITPGTNTKMKSLAPTNNIGGDKESNPVATQLCMSDNNKLHISNKSQQLMQQLLTQLKEDNPGC